MNLLKAKIYYDGSNWISDILDEDILCPMGNEEQGFKYILARDFTCINEGEIIGKVSPEVIEQMPRAN